MRYLDLSTQIIIHQGNNVQPSLAPPAAEHHGIRNVVALKNSPEEIFHRIPAITEAIAEHLTEPDYSHFVAAVKGTALRSLSEIHNVFKAKNYLLDALRPHERQLEVALQLQDKKLSDALKKTFIIDVTLNQQPPLIPFSLGLIAMGCMFRRRDYHAASTNYLDNYDGDHIPENLLENNAIGKALYKWKKAVAEKNDASKRIFAGGNCIILNHSLAKRVFLGMQIYKTELNQENFAILFETVHRHFSEAPLPEKYGLAFAAVHLAATLKKTRLPALSETEIDDIIDRYPRLLATGRQILAVLPGQVLYRRP